MGKLNSHFIGPFQILKHTGGVGNQVMLPLSLSNLHMLSMSHKFGKYAIDPMHVVELDDV